MDEIYRDLSKACFRGSFRDYQQTVLDNVESHLSDGKVHIVAAPGSGKTILGLELIRRFNQPTLVLSPSVTIRQQWGERFEERFLPEGEQLSSYVSFCLKDPRVITSITYQALHAASCRELILEPLDIGLDESDDESNPSNTESLEPTARSKSKPKPRPDLSTAENAEGVEDAEDYRDFDLIAKVKQFGIKVICLDEAHHLRSEWYKALTAFIKELEKDSKERITIISLTATPPYDSVKAEWMRYEALCGPIDEEIFVPELVMKKTLCPHQDYLYFTYPTPNERDTLEKYRANAKNCLEEIRASGISYHIYESSGVHTNLHAQLATVLKNEREFFTLFRLAEQAGARLPREISKLLKTNSKYTKKSSARELWQNYEAAFQFVIDKPDLFSKEISEELRSLIARHGLIERRRVRLLSDSKLNRMLISSMGKLHAIPQIAISEASSMGNSLRMLILTDFIKKDMLSVIGTEATLSVMGAVPVFEAVRRAVGQGSLIALLTGTLVIVPNASRVAIAAIASEKGIACRFKPLPNVAYSEAIFRDSNKYKVAVLTEAFQRGHINILIGTKSLLGEGWDSPCINSLILATFVGSFMLSNQMRGRAIRVDSQVPNKTANIWHLVTIEPVLAEDATYREKLLLSGLERTRELEGYDWETLVRRFDCFMGPAYVRPTIESGIERIDILTPPFDKKGIERINLEMTNRARARSAMAKSWSDAIPAGFYPIIEKVIEAKPEKLPLYFTFMNALPILVLLLVALLCSAFILVVVSTQDTLGVDREVIVVLAAIVVGAAILLFRAVIRFSRLLSPKRRITALSEAVLASLRQAGHIKSLGAKIRITTDPLSSLITSGLRGATIYEQNIYAAATSEALSPIENPRYVLVGLNLKRKNYVHSYACPALLASNKEDASLFCKNLSHLLGKFELVYTHSAEGREILWKCSNRSYINIHKVLRDKLVALASRC
ncbi:MAG: DEAD/DEAH box helicase family protein [Coriobacteriia bacterium]|nr:DEAD/DEAH box helicase family protein [Coriobacteriia bacterium]